MSGLSGSLREGGAAAQPRLHRRWKADLGDHVIALAWSPTGKALAAASVSGPVVVYDAATGQPSASLAGHALGTMCLSWDRHGSLLATGGQDGKVRLWAPLPSGQAVASRDGGAAWVEHVRWHPDQDVFATAAGKKLRLWSADGQMIHEYPDHPATIFDLAWRPGTGELTSAAYGQVALWSATDAARPQRLLEWNGPILKMAWSPDGSVLAHGNQDCSVQFWRMSETENLEMGGYPRKVRELAWHPSGVLLATGGSDAVTVWDCRPPGPEGSEPLSFGEHGGPITALAYQARGHLLASAAQDGKVMLLQPGKFKKSLAQSNLEEPVSGLAWSPDDRLLAAATEAGDVVVYSVL